jgi:hypothetical protein
MTAISRLTRPKYDHETPEQYEAQMMIYAIIAEEERINPIAYDPHFKVGYITSLFANILAKSPAAIKREMKLRLEYMKTLATHTA